MPNNHPSPELLAEYAAGCMPLSHALCIATHLEFCSDCLQQVSKLSSLGALVFSTQRPHSAASDTAVLKQRVMNLLDVERSVDSTQSVDLNQAQTVAIAADVAVASRRVDTYRVPRSLRQFIRASYVDASWSALTPAIRLATLLNDKDGSQIMLSRVKPGGKMFHHRHTGEEFTVVLEGSFSDESGIYRKGDFVQRGERHRHRPVVTKDAECICLMVVDAPIQFTGFFMRWLNPLVRRHHIGAS